MIRKSAQPELYTTGDSTLNRKPKLDYYLMTLEGLIVGTITGFVGAGGGFLIIPALVILAKMPMKEAVGTSLMIITVKSLLGVTGDLGHVVIDWTFLSVAASLSISGIVTGSYLSKYIPGEKLM